MHISGEAKEARTVLTEFSSRGACKMPQGYESKPDDQNPIAGPHLMVERVNSTTLSFDLHMHAVIYMASVTPTLVIMMMMMKKKLP